MKLGKVKIKKVKSIRDLPSGFGQDEISKVLKRRDEPFESWWARNHPHDWWASQRGGSPLPTHDRLLVAQLARLAFERGGKP